MPAPMIATFLLLTSSETPEFGLNRDFWQWFALAKRTKRAMAVNEDPIGNTQLMISRNRLSCTLLIRIKDIILELGTL